MVRIKSATSVTLLGVSKHSNMNNENKPGILLKEEEQFSGHKKKLFLRRSIANTTAEYAAYEKNW